MKFIKRLWFRIRYGSKVRTEDVHTWFGLSYANYLVLPRTILQSTPPDWQRRFVKLLDELQEMTMDLSDMPNSYTVQTRDGKGRFTKDNYCDYERGRRVVNLIKYKKRLRLL